jgi:hypothetical protein
MDVQKFVKKSVSTLPGPIIIWLQHWYNIFDTALISDPEWSKNLGSFSVALGSVTILYFVVIWDDWNKRKKLFYLKSSFLIFIISTALCFLLHFVVFITLFSQSLTFQTVVWLWYIAFIVFGVSLAHLLTAVVLYRFAR